MATMATSHGLSVLTNNCIKQPINPTTGLSSSFPDHPNVHYRLSEGNDYPRLADKESENVYGAHQQNFMAGVDLDDVAAQLQLLSDDEFYDRLLALKEEQKKTLKRCEELYNAKLAKEQGLTTQDHIDDIFDRNEVRPTVNGHVSESEDSMSISRLERTEYRNGIRDLSTKPPVSPLARPPSRDGGRPHAIMSKTVPVKSKMFQNRPSSAPARWRQSRSMSLDEEDWRRSMEASGEESNGDEPLETSQKDTKDLEAAMLRIDDMWDNFSLDEYVTRERRHSSASVDRLKKSKRPEDNWRHRLTIPQPFRMTLRDEMKDIKKTRAQMEVEQARLDREKAEEAECQKKFKASPAPAHIYLPLYDEIIEKNEARRRYVKQYCAEMLTSQVKPFNFMTREEEKKRHKSTPTPVREEVRREKAKTFKAKPVPDYLYDNTVNEKQMEEEEYRKIRIRMRSEELMREASLPPNMEARQRIKEQKRKDKTMKSKRQFKPRINRHVPDYDALYKQFQKEMARRKRVKEATVVEPFSLESNRVPSKRERILREIERDEETLRENRWPYRSARITPRSGLTAGILSTSLDSIPAKTTHSSQLRKSMTRDRMSQLTRQEELEIEEERRRRIRDMRLRKSLSERTSSIGDGSGRRETVRDRLKRMRESELTRQEEYERELSSMKDRIDNRPLLVERQSQVNARKKAEKKFANTLRSVGLDEDFLHSHSSAAASQSHGDYGDSFDDTAAKSLDADNYDEN